MNRFLKFIFLILVAAGFPAIAPAQVYVVYRNAGLISEYDADTGALVNETLVMGLKQPHGLCLSHDILYVVQEGNGTVGEYDAKTGAPINARLVTGLNMPQAIATDGTAIYVTTFDRTGGAAVGKYDAITGATMNPALVSKLSGPSGIAVSGNKLFVATQGHSLGAEGYVWLDVYDATNGADLHSKFGRTLAGVENLFPLDGWLYITGNGGGPKGAVFKLNVETGASVIGWPFIRPLVIAPEGPSAITVSGDEIYLGGHGTGIAKYNATTGEVINANFIPSLADRLGGIAVAPREHTGDYAMAETKFAVRNFLSNFAFVLAVNGNYVFLCVGVVVALVAAGLCALLFRSRTPVPIQAPAPLEQPAVAPAAPDVAVALPPPSEPEQPAQPAPVKTPVSVLLVAVIVIAALTLIAAAILGYFAYLWAVSTYLDQVQMGNPSGTK